MKADKTTKTTSARAAAIRAFTCTLAASLVFLTAHALGGEPLAKASLNPFPDDDLKTVRQAARALKGPSSADLQAALSFYKEFQGSWMPNAAKPNPQHVASLDALKARLEKATYPEWFVRIRDGAETQKLDMVFDSSNAHFLEHKGSAETERLKALGIVYLTEHELNREGAAGKGAGIISVLIVKTPLDADLHAFYARFLLDAHENAMAWKEACLGLYLDPAPDRAALSFVAFVGRIAVPDQWEPIKQMLNEACVDPRDADAVVREWTPRFQKNSSIRNVPVPAR